MYLPQWFVASLALFRSAYQPGDYSTAIASAGDGSLATSDPKYCFSVNWMNGAQFHLDYDKAEEGAIIKL